MLDELRDWWLTTTPETRTAFQVGSLVLVALLCGHFLAAMVTRVLRAWNFDATLRVPGSGRVTTDADSGLTRPPSGRSVSQPCCGWAVWSSRALSCRRWPALPAWRCGSSRSTC